MFDVVSVLQLPAFILHKVALLSGALHLALAECLVAVLSTWQRSRQALARPEIQGRRRQQNVSHVDMDNKEDESKRVPTFDGKLDQYRDYRKRALLYLHGLEDTKQLLAAPRLISNLSGSASEVFREKNPGDFRHANGVMEMLRVLDARFQFTPEQELSDWLENLLYRVRRNRNEETTAFTTRFETTLSKVEDLISTEQKAEKRRQADLAKAEYRRQSLDYMVALQAYNDAVAALQEGQDPPAAPVAPAPPAEQPDPKPFVFPEVMKGFLYLRHVGISLQTRASLLRSSGGSLRYDKVSELLRKTELDAMVASRTMQQANHSYLAEPQEDDFDDDDDEAYDTDHDDDEDEDDEDDDQDEDPEDDDEPDEEMDTAMLGYLEARKKLMALRVSVILAKEPVGSMMVIGSLREMAAQLVRVPLARAAPVAGERTSSGSIGPAIGPDSKAMVLEVRADRRLLHLRGEPKGAARESQGAKIVAKFTGGSLWAHNTWGWPWLLSNQKWFSSRRSASWRSHRAPMINLRLLGLWTIASV